MEDEIITKLKSALSKPIQKECQVVYILSEIRKLLEKLKNKSSFPVLNFYANWVLHPEIGETSPVRPILEEIERTILNKNYDTGAVMAIVDFEEFCREIGVFLKGVNINNPLLDIKYWQGFRRLLVDILADCPLKPKYGNIEEFCFKKMSFEGSVDYEIKFKNNIHKPISGRWSFLNY